MDFKDSETKKNLEKAFSGESMARNKYNYFASKAKKEGYEQIADIFLETADNEKEHAKIWAKYLNLIGDTKDNLQEAIDGETYEYETMYQDFAKKAKEEGFDDIAEKFLHVAEIEKKHKERFEKLLNNIQNNEVFSKKTGIHIWICRNCGHIHIGSEAPEKCPTCDHSKAYFELWKENY